MPFFSETKMDENCETTKFNEMLGVLKSKLNENGLSKVKDVFWDRGEGEESVVVHSSLRKI